MKIPIPALPKVYCRFIVGVSLVWSAGCGSVNSSVLSKTASQNSYQFADDFASITSHEQRIKALGEVERRMEAILQKREKATSRGERLHILGEWQEALELSLILRHVYAKDIVFEMQKELFRNNLSVLVSLANQLREVGNGDFSKELLTIWKTLRPSPEQDAVERAIAHFAHGNENAAWLLFEFTQRPTVARLKNLVRSGLPAPWIFSDHMRTQISQAQSLSNTLDALINKLDALGDLKAQVNPTRMAKSIANRKKAYEHMRDAVSKAVQTLLPEYPEAVRVAEPLLTPPKGKHDGKGFHYTLHNITVREGDVVAWRFYPAAYSWEAFSDSTGRYSHVGIVSFSPEGEPLIYDQDVASVNPIAFDDALHRGAFVSIFRDTTLSKSSRMRLNSAVQAAQPLTFKPFDFHFDLNDSSRFYCSEFVLALRSQAGLSAPAEFAFTRSPKAGKFFEQLGVFEKRFMAPGAFLLDNRFSHIGTFYQDGAAGLVAANAMITAMFEAFEKSRAVDFSKSEGGTNPALSMQFARLLNVGGMRDMAPAFAKNFRAMDRSVMLGQSLVEQGLAAQKIELKNLAAYKLAADKMARDVSARIYKRAFLYE